MKILVTGGTGFIGRHLLDALRPDDEIYVLARHAAQDRQSSRCLWIKHDLREPALPAILPDAIDTIYHFAAQTGASSIVSSEEHHQVNTIATRQLLEYAKRAGATAFIYSSSGGVYGPKETPAGEGDPLSPGDFYNHTKYESELLIRKYAAHFRTAILRLYFPYGPGQGRQRFVMSLIDKVRRGEEIVLHDGGKPRLNPIFITDAIEAICRIAELPDSCVMNVAGTEATDIRKLSVIIGELLSRKPLFRDVAGPVAGNLLGDISLMTRKLGLSPRVGLRDGLRNTIMADARET